MDRVVNLLGGMVAKLDTLAAGVGDDNEPITGPIRRRSPQRSQRKCGYKGARVRLRAAVDGFDLFRRGASRRRDDQAGF